MTHCLIIDGNPASKKTSNRVVRAGRQRRIRVLPSKVHEAWLDSALWQLRKHWHHPPLSGALWVSALFYRGDHRRVDLSNLIEALADCLQRARVIEDDYAVVSWDGSRRLFDKVRPRCEVIIREAA